MMSLSAANDSNKAAQASIGVRSIAALPKSKSAESLQKLCQDRHKVHKIVQQPRPVQPTRLSQKTDTVSIPNNAKEISRLELLLAQKGTKQIFRSSEESLQSQKTNKAIKLSAQWTDVQKAVSKPGGVFPGNAAYALYRLGCLNSFASRKRRADLAASAFVPALLNRAISDIGSLDAGSLALILDGCARLQHHPPTTALNMLATAAERMAPSFASSQMPLVLWAFSILGFAPPVSLLHALDRAVCPLVDSLSPQGLCLVLTGFQAAKYPPSQQTLDQIAEKLYRMLLLFKPSEMAASLEAFASFGYQPADYIITAILDHRLTEGSNSLTAECPLISPQIDPCTRNSTRQNDNIVHRHSAAPLNPASMT